MRSSILLTLGLALPLLAAACGDSEANSSGQTGTTTTTTTSTTSDATSTTTSSSGGGMGGMGGMGGDGGMAGHNMGGMGGSGGSEPECAVPEDCPDPGNECVARTCEGGVCGTSNVDLGMPVAVQNAGDCVSVVCDGSGSTTTQPDDLDIEDDGNECTTDTCVGGSPDHTATDPGTMCVSVQGTYCDGAGSCVECVADGNCLSNICQANVCVPANCVDGTLNGLETDIDCGGGVCAPCDTNGVCVIAADCVSSVCTGGACQAASCSDNTKNANETGIDCGGGTCNACVAGMGCNVSADCVDLVCTNKLCVAASCNDGVTNGTETDLDCGGACAVKCGPNKSCGANQDCAGGSCVGGVCAATCSDGVKNNTETDVDCGGPNCAACANGKICVVNNDCQTTTCAIGKCAGAVNGCTFAAATDMTNQANVTVKFGAANGNQFAYAPQCVRVSPGTNVMFDGSNAMMNNNAFQSHPLGAGSINGAAITLDTDTTLVYSGMGTSKSFALTSSKTYPYYCTFHYAGGMYGTVFVQ